ncbi:MAG: sigma-70 family RNA polymerase sigma factor [Tetrasphaera sp.]
MSAQETLIDRATAAFAAYRDGDPAGMSDLVDLLTPMLWRLARAQGLSSDDARDSVQSAWLQLVTHSDGINDPHAVVGWLLVTVRRDAWRRSSRPSRNEVELDETAHLPTFTPGPQALAELNERQAILWEHISGLTALCQQLMSVIAYADRPDYAGLAAHLGIPVGSIGPTRGRCLGKLRTSLSNDPRWTE